MVLWAERFEKVTHYSNQSLNMIILSEYMMNTCENTITKNIAHGMKQNICLIFVLRIMCSRKIVSVCSLAFLFVDILVKIDNGRC